MTSKAVGLEYPVDAWFADEPYSKIPKHMQEAIIRYIVERLPTGSFLQAVIENNLRDAVNRADSENLVLLKTYVQFFYNRAPAGCSGYPQVYKDWLAGRV